MKPKIALNINFNMILTLEIIFSSKFESQTREKRDLFEYTIGFYIFKSHTISLNENKCKIGSI
jgi:hypothetical protein